MGEIAGAGLVSHAPIVMFPEPIRIKANDGNDFTLATGLTRLREDVIDTTAYDTVIVFDSHWATTTDFVVTAHRSRSGVFTSDEMPSAIHDLPYDLPGDPELADAIAAGAEKYSTWITPVDDPNLPIHYATLNPWTYLGQSGKAWISVSVCQTATTADFLRTGQAVGEAVARLDRQVLLVASGGLSHVFWPLAELRARMAGDPANIISPEARAADEQRIAWLEEGHHAEVIRSMPEFLHFGPEANFGHYLTLAGVIGGEDCVAPGTRFSEYESGIGTGHAHVWFPRPVNGWNRSAAS